MEHDSGRDWHEQREPRRRADTGTFGAADRGFASRPSDGHTVRLRRLARNGLGGPAFRRQFAALLAAAAFLSAVAVVIAACLISRGSAIDAAQAAAARHLLVAQQTLNTYGQGVTARDGQLYTTAGYRLTGDTALLQQVTALTGDGVAFYQLQNGRLIAIASDLPLRANGAGGSPGSGVLGDLLTGPALQAMRTGCVASPRAGHHAGYRGQVTVSGVSYVAALAPLDDAQGACVGALMVAMPMDRINAPLLANAGLLLLLGLALSALVTLLAFRLAGPLSRPASAALATALCDVGGTAARLEALTSGHTARANRQTTSARQLIEDLRALGEVASALEHGVAMLRDSTGAIWAELSYPGPSVESQPGFRAARQTAVVASQIGASAQQAGVLCQRLRARMNQVIAEAGILGDGGREVAMQARHVSAAVARVEQALDCRARGVKSSSSAHRWAAPLKFLASLKTSVVAWLPEAWQEAISGDGEELADDGTSATGRHGTDTAGAVASWSLMERTTTSGRHPAIGRTTYGPRTGRTGRLSSPNLWSTGFHTSTHRTPSASGGPQPGGSHSSASGRQWNPWLSDGEDQRHGGSRGALDQTGGTGSLGGRDANGQDGPPRPRLTPRPEHGNWMNDQP